MKANVTRVRVTRKMVHRKLQASAPDIGTKGTIGTRLPRTLQNRLSNRVPVSGRVPWVPMVPFSAVCVCSFFTLHTLGTDPTVPTGTTDPKPLPVVWSRVEPTSKPTNRPGSIVPVGSVVPLSEVHRMPIVERPTAAMSTDSTNTPQFCALCVFAAPASTSLPLLSPPRHSFCKTGCRGCRNGRKSKDTSGEVLAVSVTGRKHGTTFAKTNDVTAWLVTHATLHP